jgi:hypothetical protein
MVALTGPRDPDEQGQWPISRYVGKHPRGHWEFIEHYSGTRLGALQRAAFLQAEDIGKTYRLWDDRIM